MARFEITHEQNTKSVAATSVTIIVDRETGVQYLCTAGAVMYTGGITPLIDKDGKPLLAE